jgi:hypothetical protein
MSPTFSHPPELSEQQHAVEVSSNCLFEVQTRFRKSSLHAVTFSPQYFAYQIDVKFRLIMCMEFILLSWQHKGEPCLFGKTKELALV